MKPFRIDVPQTELDDLNRRLAATRFPDPVPGDPTGSGDWSRGVPPAYLRELTEYWHASYDWRTQEAALNELPQYTTEIDGQTIHFMHVESPHRDATPLLITHGYPGSFVEFTKIVRQLADPDDPADAFHVVVPSVPGFGFSTPLSDGGWEVGRTTRAFAELMSRLGYQRFGAQGGDIGAGVAGRLAATLPDRVIGTHVNSDRGALALAGEHFPLPDHLTADERAIVEQAQQDWKADRGYLDLQSHRPATIAAALTDSPVGQLAWIAEKFQTWTNPRASTPDEAVDRDQLLTLISIYWFTRSGSSAARFLYEAAHSQLDWVAPSAVPTGWAVFNASPVVRRIMDADHRIAHWSEFSEGGHVPAMEAGDLLVTDVRSFFRSLRS
jgi:epoxide hydrolase